MIFHALMHKSTCYLRLDRSFVTFQHGSLNMIHFYSISLEYVTSDWFSICFFPFTIFFSSLYATFSAGNWEYFVVLVMFYSSVSFPNGRIHFRMCNFLFANPFQPKLCSAFSFLLSPPPPFPLQPCLP